MCLCVSPFVVNDVSLCLVFGYFDHYVGQVHLLVHLDVRLQPLLIGVLDLLELLAERTIIQRFDLKIFHLLLHVDLIFFGYFANNSLVGSLLLFSQNYPYISVNTKLERVLP